MRKLLKIVFSLLAITGVIFTCYTSYGFTPPANLSQERIAVFVDTSFRPLFHRETIQIINVDSLGLTTVVNRGNLDWAVEWSPDGDKIIYFDFVTRSSYKLSVNSLFKRPELFLKDTRFLEPSWSPDSTRILYSSRTGAIDSFDFETQETRSLVTRDDNGYSPDWSPNGQKIALALNDYTSGIKSSLAVMDFDGSNLKQITPNDDSRTPKWSPDGQKILFERDEDIYVMNSDGSNIQALTNDRASYMPDWSPDGTRIVFVSSLHEQCGDWFYDTPPFCTNEIRVMNADGTGVCQVLK